MSHLFEQREVLVGEKGLGGSSARADGVSAGDWRRHFDLWRRLVLSVHRLRRFHFGRAVPYGHAGWRMAIYNDVILVIRRDLRINEQYFQQVTLLICSFDAMVIFLK